MQPVVFLRTALRGTFVTLHLLLGVSVASALRMRHGRHWHLSDTGQGMIRWWMQNVTRCLGIRIAQYGQPAGRQVLLTANHVSFLDIIVISSIMPVRFLAKDTLRYWPIVGYLSMLSGTLFIKRGRRSLLARTIENLRHALHLERPVAVFPEGTTSLGNSVMKFHPGLYQAAIDSNAPVQAIALRYVRNGQSDRIAAYIGKDNFIMTLLRVINQPATHVHLTFCEPVTSQDKTRQQLALHTHGQVSRAIEQGSVVPLH